MVEIWRASRVSAYSSRSFSAIVSDRITMYMIGWSFGLTLRKLGGRGSALGSWPSAAEIAAWTSWAALSMLRSSANWMVILVWPIELDDVIWSMPGMVENWFSSGPATPDAMVTGSAPGSWALTLTVGKSIFGRSDTGRVK